VADDDARCDFRFLRFERSLTPRSPRVSTPATRFRNSQPRYKTPALYLRTVSHEPNASHRQLHHARVQCTVLTYVTTMLLMRHKHSATCCNLLQLAQHAQIRSDSSSCCFLVQFLDFLPSCRLAIPASHERWPCTCEWHRRHLNHTNRFSAQISQQALAFALGRCTVQRLVS
jgi:hypothetical protein